MKSKLAKKVYKKGKTLCDGVTMIAFMSVLTLLIVGRSQVINEENSTK